MFADGKWNARHEVVLIGGKHHAVTDVGQKDFLPTMY